MLIHICARYDCANGVLERDVAQRAARLRQDRHGDERQPLSSKQDSQGQSMALAFRSKSVQPGVVSDVAQRAARLRQNRTSYESKDYDSERL